MFAVCVSLCYNTLVDAFLPSALPDTSVTLNSLQSFISSNLPQLANITPVVIPHNYNPPAAIALASCIYLLLIQPEIASRRYLYVGESVSVVKRLSRHRYRICAKPHIVMYH